MPISGRPFKAEPQASCMPTAPASVLRGIDADALAAGAVGIGVSDPLAALQDLAAWHRTRLPARVVGIAGSNGKTTTKELLAQVCAAHKPSLATLGNLNNQIGLPLTLLRADGAEDILILEMGTSGPGELSLLGRLARPHIGVITSIAEEHTEMLTDLSGVIAAETELIATLPANGLAIINGDDAALVEAVARQARCRVVTFGEKDTNTFRAADIRVSRKGTRFVLRAPVGTCPVHLGLLGSHFALAAWWRLPWPPSVALVWRRSAAPCKRLTALRAEWRLLPRPSVS